ncbi:hypothetical protein EOT10_26350 [Streptomyces antnestii]|uniref:Uncharacterized protein n=1 Tax=Streptomyces antnestii TaxID=2494256 RepID=A0A437PF05_9ACTN|nr:hypothetical protein EOT10_26350 [Streptomyces sp. San01]
MDPAISPTVVFAGQAQHQSTWCLGLSIPEKTDSQAARLRKGSRGGRPPGFDEDRYKKRNTVERAINRMKQSRAIATRYDKRGYVFLGTATVAAIVIWRRT